MRCCLRLVLPLLLVVVFVKAADEAIAAESSSPYSSNGKTCGPCEVVELSVAFFGITKANSSSIALIEQECRGLNRSSTFVSECVAAVPTLLPEFLGSLAKGTPLGEVCHQLGLCAVGGSSSAPPFAVESGFKDSTGSTGSSVYLPTGTVCGPCYVVVSVIAKFNLTSSAPPALKLVDEACSQLNATVSWKGRCHSEAQENLEAVFQKLHDHVALENACFSLHLCSSFVPTSTYPSSPPPPSSSTKVAAARPSLRGGFERD